MNISNEIRLVSPDDAQAWLASVHNHGKLDQRLINAYSRDMGAGRWKINGEPLIFDNSGKLLSGRIRLHACIRAKVNFPTLIVRGVDEVHFDTIDALRRRTLGDVLTIRREKNGRALASALAYIARFNAGAIEASGTVKSISAQMLLLILESHPDIRTSIELTRDVHPTIPHGMAAALHYLFSQVDAARASAFFQETIDGSNDEQSPPTQLKKQMEELISKGGARSSKLILGLTIKAWELYRSGQRRQLLRYAPEVEAFPKLTGILSDLTNTYSGSLNGAAGIPLEMEHDRPILKLEVTEELISPERADELLALNTGNRSIAVAVVDKYARDMKEGNWALNGQSIKIGRSGRLLDGQHRLNAAIKAKRGFRSLIVNGLDDDVFDTFDLGARRAIGDILKERGEINTSSLGAVLRQAWIIENDLVQHRTATPTVNELLMYLDAWPEIRESVKNANRFRGTIDPSMGCALHFFLKRAHKTKGEEFIDGLITGADLSKESPILKLINRLKDDRISKKRSMSDAEKLAVCIKSWNAFYAERHLGTLKWQNIGPTKEAFPTVAGLNRAENSNEAA